MAFQSAVFGHAPARCKFDPHFSSRRAVAGIGESRHRLRGDATDRVTDPGYNNYPWAPEVFCGFAAAARFASHRAFIAAANCARRSGVMFSFFFAFGAGFRARGGGADFTDARAVELGLLFFAGEEVLAGFFVFPRTGADFFRPVLPPVTAAPSFNVSLASLFASFFKRFCNRRILLLRLLRFFIGGGLRRNPIRSRIAAELMPNPRACHAL